MPKLPPPPVKKSKFVEDLDDEPKKLKPVVLEEDGTWVKDEDEDSAGEDIPKLDVANMRARVKKLLGVSTYEPADTYWLDTGYSELNAVYGSREKGLPYGKIYETSGMKHGGKTAVANIIAGLAQKDGAAVIYVDLENSRDPLWAGKLGLDFENVIPVYSKLIRKKQKAEKKSQPDSFRLQSAELIFQETEYYMAMSLEAGFKKQFILFDSIANINTELAVEAGATDRNMRVNVDRAQFLSATLPRWASLAANYNAIVFFINQLRTKPGVAFGDPNYTPGGNAIPFAASIQTRVRRLGKGHILQNGNVIGIKGIIENKKNKAGAGSLEQERCAFKIRWHKAMAKYEFIPVQELEDE